MVVPNSEDDYDMNTSFPSEIRDEDGNYRDPYHHLRGGSFEQDLLPVLTTRPIFDEVIRNTDGIKRLLRASKSQLVSLLAPLFSVSLALFLTISFLFRPFISTPSASSQCRRNSLSSYTRSGSLSPLFPTRNAPNSRCAHLLECKPPTYVICLYLSYPPR